MIATKSALLFKISLHGNFIISCLNIISNQKDPEKADYFQRVILNRKFFEQTACEITQTKIIVRFEVGFPANGRTINAPELEKILFDFLPNCVNNVFYYQNLNKKEVESVIFLAEDQMYIRKKLTELGLVCFVANGSVLPRESGVSNRHLKNSIPFIFPGFIIC